MKKKLCAFQSYSYTFPKKAYLIYLFIKQPGEEQIIWWPCREITTRPKTGLTQIKEFTQMVKQTKRDYYAFESPFLLELQLQELIPLNKEMWDPAGIIYPETKRILDFMACLYQPEWYQVLVVPEGIFKGKECLEAAIPIRDSGEKIEWNQWMRQIKYPVDGKATHVALYKPGAFYCLNEKQKLEMVSEPIKKWVN